MANKRIPVEADKFYHLYNHVVGDENLFRNENNYKYFLKKYAEYFNPIAETFAYCLMPNHFHFLIKIKDEKTVLNFYKEKYHKFAVAVSDPEGFQNPQGLRVHLIQQNSQHIGNFFNAYAKAYNKQYERKGSLFVPDFFRKDVNSEEYLRKLVHYIHYNPVHHGFVKDLRDWEFSSYESFFSDKTTNLQRKQVIDWFDDIENFLYFHKKDIDGFEPEFD